MLKLFLTCTSVRLKWLDRLMLLLHFLVTMWRNGNEVNLYFDKNIHTLEAFLILYFCVMNIFRGIWYHGRVTRNDNMGTTWNSQETGKNPEVKFVRNLMKMVITSLKGVTECVWFAGWLAQCWRVLQFFADIIWQWRGGRFHKAMCSAHCGLCSHCPRALKQDGGTGTKINQ